MLLSQHYTVKLSDFGLAKSVNSPDHSHISTRVVGTHGYAAPEYVATGIISTNLLLISFHKPIMET